MANQTVLGVRACTLSQLWLAAGALAALRGVLGCSHAQAQRGPRGRQVHDETAASRLPVSSCPRGTAGLGLLYEDPLCSGFQGPSACRALALARPPRRQAVEGCRAGAWPQVRAGVQRWARCAFPLWALWTDEGAREARSESPTL